MKRSEINELIEEAIGFFKENKFALPPFAFYSIQDWKKNRDRAQEIFDLALGWDLTDFGKNDYQEKGLLLFTLRNGKPDSTLYPKTYAEKIMIVGENQLTPLHFHWHKQEDIINRGGGDLVFTLYNSTPEEGLDDSLVSFISSGIKQEVKAGEEFVLKPGQCLTLPRGLYHSFYGRNGKVLVGEVSMVNDDNRDNRFYEPVGRFPDIEEDVEPTFLLCNDYQKFIGKEE